VVDVRASGEARSDGEILRSSITPTVMAQRRNGTTKLWECVHGQCSR